MNWLLSVVARIGLSQDIVKDVLHAICKIHFYEPQETHAMPEDEELTDDQRERIMELNEEIEKTNEQFNKLKQYV